MNNQELKLSTMNNQELTTKLKEAIELASHAGRSVHLGPTRIMSSVKAQVGLRELLILCLEHEIAQHERDIRDSGQGAEQPEGS